MATIENGADVPEPLSAKYKESFAYLTIKDRLPVILTKVIDLLHRERHEIAVLYGEVINYDVGNTSLRDYAIMISYSTDSVSTFVSRNSSPMINMVAKEENKEVIGHLSKLRNEMMTNKPVISLRSSFPDVVSWNSYLEEQTKLHGSEPKWFESAWLYVECYLYRRIKESFLLSTKLQDYDPFKKQKDSALLSSMDAIVLLASALEQAIDEIHSRKEKSVILEHFIKFVEVSLWGNKCDLSISAGKENSQTVSPLTQLNDLRRKIVVNDSEKLWNILQQANEDHCGKVRVDVILDNAGFELFTDLCLIQFLEAASLVNQVHLYVKIMPWFVSDTLAEDILWVLKTLSNSSEKNLVNLSNQWFQKIESGKWIIEHELFWTLPHDYSEMKKTDIKLYSKLSQSDLIIFKGDLNYRKLTSDRQWEITTPFLTSLRGFLPGSLCTLRTIKADVLTGLTPEVKTEIDKLPKNWMFTGDFAVIQCALKE